jgi:hypothetical protein
MPDGRFDWSARLVPEPEGVGKLWVDDGRADIIGRAKLLDLLTEPDLTASTASSLAPPEPEKLPARISPEPKLERVPGGPT